MAPPASANDYVIWSQRDVGNACLVNPPEEVDKVWELQCGVPRVHDFPANAFLRMNPRHPKAMGLTDNLLNLSLLIVASRPLQQFLAIRKLKNVEYLPVSIMNHKGRIASSDYFLVHPILPQDCLDLAQSGPQYNHIAPADIDWLDKLVIEPGRIDPEVELFRIKDFDSVILVRRTLADELSAAGFSGVAFSELDEYGQ